MKNWIKIFAVVVIIFLGGCSNQYFGEGNINKNLELKVDKSKILFSAEIDDIVCDEKGQNCINKGKIEKYYYISNKKIPKDKIEKDGKTYDEIIEKRTNNARFYRLDKSKDVLGAVENHEYWEAHFYVGMPFYYDGSEWYQVEVSTTTTDAWIEQTATTTAEIISWWLFGHPVLADTYYSGTGDGVALGPYDATWAGARGATTAGSVNNGANYYIVGDREGGNNYRCWRGFFPINTTALNNVTVTASSFFLYSYGTNSVGTPIFGVVESTQADTSTLATTDLDNINFSPEGANRVTVDNNAVYREFVFNSDGFNFIKDDGSTWTKLAVLMDDDIDNDPPVNSRYGRFYFADETGTSKDPYLSVTYTASGGSAAPLDGFKSSLIEF